MKSFSLGITIFLAFLVLILAFQNLAARTQYFLLLFSSVDTIPPFFVILILSFLGTITGIFYTLSAFELMKPDDDMGEDDKV